MSTTVQHFGIKYPFTTINSETYYVDTNTTLKDKIRSQIMHVIFTPKGQRIMNPEFGTDLIRYIFDPNDNDSWESVKHEIQESVSRWVKNVKLVNIEVARNADDVNAIYVRIDYAVIAGNQTSATDSIVVEL